MPHRSAMGLSYRLILLFLVGMMLTGATNTSVAAEKSGGSKPTVAASIDSNSVPAEHDPDVSQQAIDWRRVSIDGRLSLTCEDPANPPMDLILIHNPNLNGYTAQPDAWMGLLRGGKDGDCFRVDTHDGQKVFYVYRDGEPFVRIPVRANLTQNGVKYPLAYIRWAAILDDKDQPIGKPIDHGLL